MSTTQLTPSELRARGFAALLRELGPVDFVRFVQQFESGSGDYTREREQWLGNLSLEQIEALIAQQRQAKSPKCKP
jgi:hypothetical protein